MAVSFLDDSMVVRIRMNGTHVISGVIMSVIFSVFVHHQSDVTAKLNIESSQNQTKYKLQIRGKVKFKLTILNTIPFLKCSAKNFDFATREKRYSHALLSFSRPNGRSAAIAERHSRTRRR